MILYLRMSTNLVPETLECLTTIVRVHSQSFWSGRQIMVRCKKIVFMRNSRIILMLLVPAYTLRTTTLELHKKHAETLLQYNVKGYCHTCQLPNGLNPLVLTVSLNKKEIYWSLITSAARNPSSQLSGWLSLNLGSYHSQTRQHNTAQPVLRHALFPWQTSFEIHRLLLSRAPEKNVSIL